MVTVRLSETLPPGEGAAGPTAEPPGAWKSRVVGSQQWGSCRAAETPPGARRPAQGEPEGGGVRPTVVG